MNALRAVLTAVAKAIAVGTALLSMQLAAAAEKPLWEAGLGIGALRFPDYRGSDESQVYPVPVPYFVYRGNFLKADRDGMRGELFNRRYVELNISLNATIPVNSDDNTARRGMPDLRSTIEIGPSLDLHLWRSADENVKLDLVMPIRAPITVESSPQSIGLVFSPRLNIDFQDIGRQGWDFGFGAGPIYADRKFHDYFYSVVPQFVAAERSAYRADGGYSGTHVLTSLSKRFPGYWVGAYLRYDALSGAVFEDSPLMRSRSYWSGGVGIAWMIGQSKRMVESDD